MCCRAFILVALGLLFSRDGLAQLGFTLSNGATKTEIPFELHNNLIVVPVILNNQLPLKFIIDTGVRTTILTEKIYSDILHLAYTKKFTINAPGGENVVNAYITNNVTIDLPGIHGQGHAMLVLENDYLDLRSSLGSEVHGILGYELFSRFVVKIDYQNRLLTLMAPQKFKPSRRYARLPITVEDTKPYYVAELHVNDTSSVSAKLMIDTGASHGLFLDSESNPKIVVPTKNIDCIIGKGLGGEITGRMARIKSIKIGRYTISNMIASFPDPDSYPDKIEEIHNVYRNGSIGGEALSRFHVIFDFPREKIYVRPNVAFRKRSYYNMSGLTVKATGQSLHEFEVENVRTSSAGDIAGLKKGDRIIKIRGLQTITMDLSQVNGYFESRPGKKVDMVLLRDGQLIETTVVLKEEI